MGFISVSGEPGCRPEELARFTARRLQCELVTEAVLDGLLAREFAEGVAIPPRAWPDAVTSVLVGLGAKHHLVISVPGCELLLGNFPGLLRVHLTAPRARGIAGPMLDRQMISSAARLRKARFGKSISPPPRFDLVLNAATFECERAFSLVEKAARHKEVFQSGLVTAGGEAQVQFQVRLRLAKFGLVPSDRTRERGREFGHPSEKVFANLLDFYRVAWEYEPRTFPLQWDASGRILEAFTPDFYLPEFDLYVELTTLRQTLVTRKNRKVRWLRAVYPHINIQVFYQKDVQELLLKHGESVAS